MQLNEKAMNDAMKIRTSIEYAIRSIFDIPQDRKNIGTNIDRLKKSFGISDEEQNKIKKVWKIASETLHLNQKENLKEDDNIEVLKILRNIMSESSDRKQEYLFNGLIYYKIDFTKSNKILDKFEHRDEDSDIFIQKEYFNNLTFAR